MNKFIKGFVFSSVLLGLGALGSVEAQAAEHMSMAKPAEFSEAASGKTLDATQLAKKLKKYDVVFFGEFHDQAEIHAAELELMHALCKQSDHKLALTMEMFEADNQTKLDAFLADELSEADFLATSRPWPNYATDYAPLVNLAKEHKLPVVAANVPRFLAAHVAKHGGSTEGIEEQYQQWLPNYTYAPEGAYHDKFFAHLSQGMQGSGMKVPEQRLAAMYAAQCLKDDKMAESLAAFADAQPELQLLHINGCFHSDGHLGTAQKLETLRPKLKVAVITPLERKQKGEQPAGDFVVWFDRVEKQ